MRTAIKSIRSQFNEYVNWDTSHNFTDFVTLRFKDRHYYTLESENWDEIYSSTRAWLSHITSKSALQVGAKGFINLFHDRKVPTRCTKCKHLSDRERAKCICQRYDQRVHAHLLLGNNKGIPLKDRLDEEGLLCITENWKEWTGQKAHIRSIDTPEDLFKLVKYTYKHAWRPSTIEMKDFYYGKKFLRKLKTSENAA